MLDLWTLRVLVIVADSGSFSGAATALSLTQPAVSRQMAALERRAGTALFVRQPRGVRLTHAGEIAVHEARAILARVADLEAQLAALSGLGAGRVRMSAFASANTSLVPAVIARFAARHPGIEVSLVDVSSKETVAAVRDGRIDLGLITQLDRPTAGAADGIELIPLVEDAHFIALPRDHRLAGNETVRLSDLGDETWIDGAHPDCLGQLEGLHRAMGSPPRIGYVCDDWNGKQALVAAGLGIMLFPALAAPSVRDDVALRRITKGLPPRPVYVVVAERRHRSAAVTAMIELLGDSVAG